MNTITNHLSNEIYHSKGAKRSYPFNKVSGRPPLGINLRKDTDTSLSSIPNIGQQALMTRAALSEMTKGGIPDLWNVCKDIFETFYHHQAPYSALQFIPVLQQLEAIDQVQTEKFLGNPETRHVLIENELLKVVLIHWQPGQISSIHGHPQGGCVFKVLQGSLEELRYTTDASPKLLAVSTYQSGSMAYIDDKMGYHAVGNPFNTSAISLHVYTPGKKSNQPG